MTNKNESLNTNDHSEKILEHFREAFKILDLDALEGLSDSEVDNFFMNVRSSFCLDKEMFSSIVEGHDLIEEATIADCYLDRIPNLSARQGLIVWHLLFEMFNLGRIAGLAKGRVEGDTNLKNYTKFVKEKVKPEDITRKFLAKSGSMRFRKSREAAFAWLETQLKEDPTLSKNRLAAMLEAESKEECLPFGRVIPEGTAKDYARKCKNMFENRG